MEVDVWIDWKIPLKLQGNKCSRFLQGVSHALGRSIWQSKNEMPKKWVFPISIQMSLAESSSDVFFLMCYDYIGISFIVHSQQAEEVKTNFDG